MSPTLNACNRRVGIDIGKNSFHIVGHDERGTIVLRQKWSRAKWRPLCQHAAVPDRHGGLCRRASSQSQASSTGHDAR